MAITWQSHDNHIAITSQSHGNHIAIAWQSHGNHIAITWQSHNNLMAITSQSHGNHMAISWQSHSNLMAISWQSHSNHGADSPLLMAQNQLNDFEEIGIQGGIPFLVRATEMIYGDGDQRLAYVGILRERGMWVWWRDGGSADGVWLWWWGCRWGVGVVERRCGLGWRTFTPSPLLIVWCLVLGAYCLLLAA